LLAAVKSLVQFYYTIFNSLGVSMLTILNIKSTLTDIDGCYGSVLSIKLCASSRLHLFLVKLQVTANYFIVKRSRLRY